MSREEDAARHQEDFDLEFERIVREEGASPGPDGLGAHEGHGGSDEPHEHRERWEPRERREPREAEDFREPDPDLPAIGSRALWSWTVLAAGIGLLLLVLLVPAVPDALGMLGVGAAVGAVVALLAGVPRSRRRDGDGAVL